MIPYQIAILRYRHNASAGELVNIGVVMWLPTQRRLLFKVNERYGRLTSFFKDFDGPGYRQLVKQLRTRWEQTVGDLVDESPLSSLTPPPETLDEVLGVLLHEDASCFQVSTTMGGIAQEPEKRLEQLMVEWVERHESRGPRERRDEVEVWTGVEQRLRDRGLAGRVKFGVELTSDVYHYKFRTGWQNGKPQVLEPISFDILSPTEMIEKANTWSGRLHTLGRSQDFGFTGVIAGPQRADLQDAYNRAKVILSGAPHVRRIVTEECLDEAIADIESDLAAHPAAL